MAAFPACGGPDSLGAEACRDREDRYALIFNNLPQGLLIVDREGHLVEANPAAERILGLGPGEMRARIAGEAPWQAIRGDGTPFPEEDQPFRRALETGQPVGGVLLGLIHPERGERRWIRVSATPLFREGEVLPHQVMTSIFDVTEFQRAEARIEKRIAALTQPVDGGAIAFDELFHLSEIQRIQDEFAAATGVASIITRPDGTPITAPSNFTRLCGDIIRRTEVGCHNCRISDAALGRFEPDGPVVQTCLSGGLWDAGVRITVSGHYLANWLIGQVKDEVQDPRRMAEYARRIGADEGAFLEAFAEVPSMSRDRFQKVAAFLFNLSNQMSTVAYQNLQQARFIAERKRAEEEKSRLEAQLIQSQKMESLGSLAGGVAHDMNNVLGAILGMATSCVENLPPGGAAHQAFGTIIKAAERGGKMVRSLLSFSRQTPAEQQVLDLNAILEEEIQLLSRTTLSRIRLELDLAGDLRPIRGDASTLTNAIMNLCINAVDAMPENGTLTLRTRNVDPDGIEVRVEDTGCGMSPEVLERALDPFYTTKEMGKGTGLGLAMVFSTVKAHQGTLEIQSEPGAGTRVRIRMPSCQPEISSLGTLAASAPRALDGGLKVLVADDDELIRSSLEAILKVLGHVATTVTTGEEALAALEGGLEPDVLILDMNMPGLGGAATLPRVRTLRPVLPVLLATGRVDETIHALVRGDTAVTLLPKPFTMRELEKRLEEIGR